MPDNDRAQTPLSGGNHTALQVGAADHRAGNGRARHVAVAIDVAREYSRATEEVMANLDRADVPDREDLTVMTDAIRVHERGVVPAAADQRAADRQASNVADRLDFARLVVGPTNEVVADCNCADIARVDVPSG